MSVASEILEKYIRVDEVTGAFVGAVVRVAKGKAFKNALNARNKRIITGSSKPDAINQNNLQATDAQNAYNKINKFVDNKTNPETSLGKRYQDSQGQRTPWGIEFDRAAREE